jgi:hypothetical protein
VVGDLLADLTVRGSHTSHRPLPIAQRREVDGGVRIERGGPPKYCHNCGTAFPWTAAKLAAAKEYAADLDGLDESFENGYLIRVDSQYVHAEVAGAEEALVQFGDARFRAYCSTLVVQPLGPIG